ncbi:MAG: three-Cys-motif partner protein TcmP [Phycisphaerales bacterium]
MSKKNDDFFSEKKPWSIIKDQLLACYLKPYFAKILATQRPAFYVDGFAGKGMFDDGKPGSPVIALEIISESLLNTKFRSAGISSCFIELNYAEDLRNNISKYTDVQIIKGKYEDKIEEQLAGKQSQNVFLYIDPYGIKSLHFSVFEKLSSKKFHSIEILVNLNTFGFIREACNVMHTNFDIEGLEDIVEFDDASNGNKQKSIANLTEVAGGEYWKEIIMDYKVGHINGYEAEKQFSEKYCQKLGEHFGYVLNMPIRLNPKQRPKYRMIHATNHAQGCALMNDNMCKRWEALQGIQNQGHICLFGEDVENKLIDKAGVQKEILEVLSSHTDYIDIDVFHAEFVSKYGVRFPTGDICKELEHLYNDSKVKVKRTPEVTKKTGRPSKFWTTGRGQTVKVRC